MEVDGIHRRLVLWPASCLLCGDRSDTDNDLCVACAADLPVNRCRCHRCALPLALDALACGDCLRQPPPFEATFAPFRYGYPLDALVTRFKFGRDLAAGRVLTQLWLDHAPEIERPQMIVPVPLHLSRLRDRGYDQVLELASPIARALGLSLAANLLRRERATSPQTELDAHARRRNVRGAFAVVSAPPAHIALFDDVMTTGATVHECARVLVCAGAQRVDVWVLARASARGFT